MVSSSSSSLPRHDRRRPRPRPSTNPFADDYDDDDDANDGSGWGRGGNPFDDGGGGGVEAGEGRGGVRRSSSAGRRSDGPFEHSPSSSSSSGAATYRYASTVRSNNPFDDDDDEGGGGFGNGGGCGGCYGYGSGSGRPPGPPSASSLSTWSGSIGSGSGRNPFDSDADFASGQQQQPQPPPQRQHAEAGARTSGAGPGKCPMGCGSNPGPGGPSAPASRARVVPAGARVDDVGCSDHWSGSSSGSGRRRRRTIRHRAPSCFPARTDSSHDHGDGTHHEEGADCEPRPWWVDGHRKDVDSGAAASSASPPRARYGRSKKGGKADKKKKKEKKKGRKGRGSESGAAADIARSPSSANGTSRTVLRWGPRDGRNVDREVHRGQAKEEAGGGGVGVGSGAGSGGGSGADDNGGGCRPGSGGDDEKKGDRHRRRRRQDTMTTMFAMMSGDESKRCERPPSIREAARGLTLVEFEREAEERAAGIVAAWLSDAGLAIDDVLVDSRIAAAPPAAARDAESVATSEGVEVGVHGSPLGGVPKLDREIDRLRASARRELSLVNARLNDGVAASAAEVRELVESVSAADPDLGRLGELCTYVTDFSAHEGRGGPSSRDATDGSWPPRRDGIALTRYPRLGAAVNARRNLFRCFRELEFFAHIPSTCDRLREELRSGDGTSDEWNTVRNVCMEHVELEILLVEIEAGMKALFDDEVTEQRSRKRLPASSRKLRQQMRSMRCVGRPTSGGGGDASDSYELLVDKFLSQHVKNVWELGDEIRTKIMSGIGSSFDLARNNPAGMVALVQAVEVYERVNDQCKNMYEDHMDLRKQRQHLTDMRPAALAQIYRDFELRGLEVFRAIHMQAADTAEEDQVLNAQLTAVLRAATELVAEIEVVQSEISPCFTPHWAIEGLWIACVADVCSNQIIQQIGGPDGHSLPDLTITQLLDLVAWIEFFRETVEEMFPSIAAMHATQKAADFEEKPDLFVGNGKEVDLESAMDNLAWVNNMLWEVHRLAQEEFLIRTRTQTEEWLSNVYEADHAKNQSHGGKLTTSLCEDVFSLANVQLRTIRERLSKKSDALCMSVCLVFSMMRSKQINARDRFLQDFESCCSAANDFSRMSEKVEEALQELMDESEFPKDTVATLEASSNELLAIYSVDAVYAAQSLHVYIFEPIREAIVDDLFGTEWEEDLTHNELALTLTRTIEDFMGDLEQFIDEFLLKKAIDSLISSSIMFYVKCLLEKADSHKSNKEPYFLINTRALERIAGDILVMRVYFDGLVEDMPALGTKVEKEFEILTTIHELMSIAADISASDASDFILVLHKRIRDFDLTKHAVGDLWHLMNPLQERTVWELVESMEDMLLAVVPHDDSLARKALNRSQVSGLRLDEMVAMHYSESKRRRPVKAGAVEKMVTNWRANRTADGGE